MSGSRAGKQTGPDQRRTSVVRTIPMTGRRHQFLSSVVQGSDIPTCFSLPGPLTSVGFSMVFPSCGVTFHSPKTLPGSAILFLGQLQCQTVPLPTRALTTCHYGPLPWKQSRRAWQSFIAQRLCSKWLWHTCWSFAAHQCPAAHQLKTTGMGEAGSRCPPSAS